MSRVLVSQVKQATRTGTKGATAADVVLLSQESALSLLARSIEFGHGHLAVIRLLMAAHVGADIPESHWRYCLAIVSSPRADKTLLTLYRDAVRLAGTSLHVH